MSGQLNTGDPSGRRLWRAQANKLSEAHAVARVLDILLSDANIDADLSKQLLAEIEKQEMIALQRAIGPIALLLTASLTKLILRFSVSAFAKMLFRNSLRIPALIPIYQRMRMR